MQKAPSQQACRQSEEHEMWKNVLKLLEARPLTMVLIL